MKIIKKILVFFFLNILFVTPIWANFDYPNQNTFSQIKTILTQNSLWQKNDKTSNLSVKKKITIQTPQRSWETFTEKNLVWEALLQNNIALTPQDFVNPQRYSQIRDGDIIQIFDPGSEIIKQKIDIPYQIEYQESKNILPGKEIIIQKGKLGRKINHYQVIENKDRPKLKLLRTYLINLPQKAIIKTGIGKLEYFLTGTASTYGYGDGFHGQYTANGEIYDSEAFTAASPSRSFNPQAYLPFNTRVKITNIANGKSVLVRINDRGPYVKGRIIDLSWGAYKALTQATYPGTIEVKLEIVTYP